jgi:protein gp37
MCGGRIAAASYGKRRPNLRVRQIPAWVTLRVAVEPSIKTVSTIALGKIFWPSGSGLSS